VPCSFRTKTSSSTPTSATRRSWRTSSTSSTPGRDPPIEEFNTAVEEFRERVPDIGTKLAEIITDAHKSNAKFQAAFEKFFELCKTALNPNIASRPSTKCSCSTC